MRKLATLMLFLAAMLCGGTAYADNVEVATAATAFADIDDGYYVIKAKTKGVTGYLTHYADGGSDGIFRVVAETSAPTDAAYIWHVTKSANGLVFFNCGTLSFLSAVNAKDAASKMTVCAPLDYYVGTYRVGVFKGATYTNNSYALTDGFILAQRNYQNDTYYMHGQGNGGTQDGKTFVALGYYPGNNTDHQAATCVCFQAYAVSGYACEGLQTAYAVAITSGSTTSYKVALNGDNVETPSSLEATNLVYATTTVKETDKTVSKTNCAFTAVTTGKLHYDSEALYRIRSINNSANCKRYMSTEEATVPSDGIPTTKCVIKRADGVSDKFAPQLFTIEAGSTDGTYKIKNANTDRYISNVGSNDYAEISTAADESTAGACAFATDASVTFAGGHNNTNDGVTMLRLTIDGQYINAYGGNSSTEIHNYSSNSSTDGGNFWQIERADCMTVTVGPTGYASVCLPCAADISGIAPAKAYVGGKITHTALNLTEISGSVPAGTGFLIALNGGGDVTFPISAKTADALTEANVLKGATAKRTDFEGGANYFLAADNGKAILMQADDTFTVVPCNKAYLPKTEVPDYTNAASKKLNFDLDGGETTGIANAIQSESDRTVKYYDLSGRRVLYPANGIFVTDKGEKVLLH